MRNRQEHMCIHSYLGFVPVSFPWCQVPAVGARKRNGHMVGE